MLEKRRLPIGAEIFSDGAHFRVWAPKATALEVVIENRSNAFPLQKDEKGYFAGFVSGVQAGDRYHFRLNGEEFLYADPASRYQPDGPHGPSQIVDPSQFIWNDSQWKGISIENRVLYEMHIGTFTQQGTWQSAKSELLELADLGVTIIEMMPVHEFPGKFGWGYDGVNLFAPYHHYGSPDDLRAFINHAHALGIGVILDVVYNHFGPDGNYIMAFSDDYLTNRYFTEWGEAINFDGENAQPVREFFISNAKYWVDEFHFDGLRLDATQVIFDYTQPHILAEINQTAYRAAKGRNTYNIAENECQHTDLLDPIAEGGCGFNALWNDDFHHTLMVRLTGSREGYYHDYLGSPQEMISAIKYGYLYQGQWYAWQYKTRGISNLKLLPDAFINFIQNHDQIANSAHGDRIHLLTDPGNYRAVTALLLLAPSTPMLFQGQEFAALTPFHYFADYSEELSDKVFTGRRSFFSQFPSISTPQIEAKIPNPSDPETFNNAN